MSPRMWVMLFCMLMSLHCGIFEPKNGKGSIAIVLTLPMQAQELEKPLETLTSVYCFLKKGSSIIREDYLVRNGSYFEGTVSDLEAGSDYSAQVVGLDGNGDILGFGSSGTINVAAGRTTPVEISFVKFKPELSSPANGSSTNDDTPSFDWTDVSGGVQYELQVSTSSGFGGYSIRQADLTSCSYSATSLLSDGAYYWRVRAKNDMGNWGPWSDIWSFVLFAYETGTMMDVDGNTYPTIKIGNQWWMRENLKVTHYRNGDPIPNVADAAEWISLSTGARCDYGNDPSNVAIYGRLYNWYAANDSRNIAPQGWHVPRGAEWQILVGYLGGDTSAGGKLKETGCAHWQGPNAGATNESGFSALPGGFRDPNDGRFYGLGRNTTFWSATTSVAYGVWFRHLTYDESDVDGFNYGKEVGFSVRLVRD
jgi:uncharacterized protein (TIGR02145 family)